MAVDALSRVAAVAHRPDDQTSTAVFAPRDIVRGASLVVWAVRDGRDAAERIHSHLTAKARFAKA